MAGGAVPQLASDAVLVDSQPVPTDAQEVKGYTFEDQVVNYDKLFDCLTSTGFQATHLGQAIDIVNDMVRFFRSIYLYMYNLLIMRIYVCVAD